VEDTENSVNECRYKALSRQKACTQLERVDEEEVVVSSQLESAVTSQLERAVTSPTLSSVVAKSSELSRASDETTSKQIYFMIYSDLFNDLQGFI